jgi:hypothetical protein
MDNTYIEKLMMADLDKQGAKVHEAGDVKKALSEAAKKVEATPITSHALPMPPWNP